jgi:hypothetical protein
MSLRQAGRKTTTQLPIQIFIINFPSTTQAANVLIGASITKKHNPIQMIQMSKGPGFNHFYFVFHQKDQLQFLVVLEESSA